MSRVYMSTESVRAAISYFGQQEYASPEQIGLFFLFKAAKFNSRDYTKFPKVGNMTAAEKQKYSRVLYDLSGLFDAKSENGGNRNSLFPFSIKVPVKKGTFYNGGTPFSRVLSRVSDTIDNTLIDETKYLRRDEMDAEKFKFPPSYLEMLLQDFLKNNKIPLAHFAAWYFRFHEFEVADDWIAEPTRAKYEDFTRICTKRIIADLNLTQDELNELFVQNDGDVKYQATPVTGEELRGMLTFEADASPEVSVAHSPIDYMPTSVLLPLDVVNDLIAPHGKNVTEEQLLALLMSTRQIVLSGPPGTGKSYISNKVRTSFDDSVLIQFHPNLTYEQFIGGNTFDETGNVTARAGVFVEFCEVARANPEKKYLFLIDEINRANVSKVFGEVILTLDREYAAKLPTPVKTTEGRIIENFSIPENLYILATMNSADRSIALVDYAIRRRFAFVGFYPNSEVVDFVADYTELHALKVSALMEKLNEKLYTVLGDADLLLGQSYFMPKWAFSAGRIKWTDTVLQNLFNYYILPIIEEYTYGNKRYLLNIVGDKLPSRITDTPSFIEEITNQFGS